MCKHYSPSVFCFVNKADQPITEQWREQGGTSDSMEERKERGDFSHEERLRSHPQKRAEPQIEPHLHYSDSIMGD